MRFVSNWLHRFNKAIDNFDTSYDVSFPHAVPMIIGEIKRFCGMME